MRLFSPEDSRPLHFMGIGGAGMSALALIARRRGVQVTGCDTDVAGAADVIAAGARVFSGHDEDHVTHSRAVVYTSAVSPDHPELAAARRQGVPVVRRAEALRAVVEDGIVVGVAGTHGKTTTTVMLTEMLAAAGRDPTGIAGGRVAEWGGNARIGGSQTFVVEADEYDRSFLALKPNIAVINNVEIDHLECYGTLEELEEAFVEYAGRAEHAVVGGDDPGALRVRDRVDTQTWSVGFETADVVIELLVRSRGGTGARLRFPDGIMQDFHLSVPGVHNVRNAAMALSVCRLLECDLEAAAGALAAFGGVGRRLERLGEVNRIVVIDDYAHHPTEVRATLEAVRQAHPDRRIVAVFQPHLFSRTRDLGAELGEALTAADLVVVTSVYAAREAPISGVSGEGVAEAARRSGAEVRWMPERDDLLEDLLPHLKSGDVVVTLGAGDITRLAHELVDSLQEVA